jgi:hypothetical protein
MKVCVLSSSRRLITPLRTWNEKLDAVQHIDDRRTDRLDDVPLMDIMTTRPNDG